MNSNKAINRGSLKVAGVFFILSFLWIFFSDRILFIFFKDASQLTFFQTWKGWFYITVASVLIFYLVNREINKKNALIAIINKKSEWQNLLISNIPDIEVLLFDNNPGYILAHGNDIVLSKSQHIFKKINGLIKVIINDHKLSLTEIQSKILNGEEFNSKTIIKGKTIEIVGRHVVDDQQNVIAGLLVFIDFTKHNEILEQLSNEKKKYEALFNEHHALNLELKVSYETLREKSLEIKETNERYEAFLMQTTEGVYRIDLQVPVDINQSKKQLFNTLYNNAFLAECNPVFAEIYGYRNYSKLLKIKIADINNPVTSRQYVELLKAFVDNNYQLKNFETEEPDNQNNERYFLNHIIGIFDENKLYRLWGIKSDITRLKQYEAELIKARQQAEKSDQLKSAFLANMSHEIRTPLNGIVGFSELLCSEDPSDDQKQKYFRVIKTSTNQLLRIIDDILDISRIETDQLSVTSEKFHLNGMMNELEVYLKQEILKRQKPIETVVFKYFDASEDLILSDKQRLYQVISNLLNNSIKFTSEGAIEFGYTCENNSTLKFYVKDTGIGIPAQEHESIFKQFKQVENYVSRKYGGTGLGLSISKGIVELLGGNISVHSEEGIGSTFSFTIPLVRE